MEKMFSFLIFLSCMILFMTGGCLKIGSDAAEWNTKGETDHVMGRYDEAVNAFDQAISLDPLYGEAWRNRGLSLSLLNRTTESEESFQKALSIDPNDTESLYYRALSRSYAHNNTSALDSLDLATAIDPKSRDETITLFQSWNLRGDILTSMGRAEEGNKSYQMAHEIMMATV